MVRKARRSLVRLLADAQGLVVGQNVVFSLKTTRRGKDGERRAKRKLKVGVDIPTPAEIRHRRRARHDRRSPALPSAAVVADLHRPAGHPGWRLGRTMYST